MRTEGSMRIFRRKCSGTFNHRRAVALIAAGLILPFSLRAQTPPSSTRAPTRRRTALMLAAKSRVASRSRVARRTPFSTTPGGHRPRHPRRKQQLRIRTERRPTIGLNALTGPRNYF